MKTKINKLFISALSLLLIFGCTSNSKESSLSSSDSTSESIVDSTSLSSLEESFSSLSSDVEEEYTDLSVPGITYDKVNHLFTISKAGRYTFRAENSFFEGNILINAGENDDVKIVLDHFYIESDKDAPIKCLSAKSLTIYTGMSSGNAIIHKGNSIINNSDNHNRGAVTSVVDTKFVIDGSLTIRGEYFSAIDCYKDLTIETTKSAAATARIDATSKNNTIRGNDSVTVNCNLNIISSEGHGIVTDNSNVSSKGNQKGNITIGNCSVNIYAMRNGLWSAYDTILESNSNDMPHLNIYTSTYSVKSNKDLVGSDHPSSYSSKGIKSDNNIKISSGTILIKANDDGIHASNGEFLGNGQKGEGSIEINNGSIELYSADDAIHADNTFTLNNGNILINESREGIEANFININSGNIKIFSNDDGINCSKKINKTPILTIAGGVIDITVTGTDVDGIDSNGDFIQTGGIVITKGTNASTSSGLDCDGNASISGGTLIAFGKLETTPSLSSGITEHVITGNFVPANYNIQLDEDKTFLTTSKYTYKEIYFYTNIDFDFKVTSVK